ncbi:hypothetical protein JKG47_17775 [Acidithiobacillus sp. MC6.1]|nr:hypothetical protein [Acidithiobacillus sp. MC6.1]
MSGSNTPLDHGAEQPNVRNQSAISLKEPLADADKILRWPERIADMPDSRDQFNPESLPM